MNQKRVIISSDTNPKFIEFWPLVADAWRKLFNVEVWLALVTPPLSEASRPAFDAHGHVVCLWPVEGIPVSNQAKLARYFVAGSWGDASVCMTNDIDLLPLQREYTQELLRQRPAEHLLTIGSELYTGAEAGKFTAGYLTAESRVWQNLINPSGLNWDGFVRQFVGMKVIDHKEDVLRAVHHEDPDTFSDESLLRALLRLRKVAVCHRPRGYAPYTTRALCRSDWQFDPIKLKDGTYVEAHLPRPLHEHRERIQPLIEHLNHV